MIQFYVLSVSLNILGGLALCADMFPAAQPPLDSLRAFLVDRTVRHILGILMAVVAVFKLFNAIRGDLPILGDFVPALMGICGGVALLPELDANHPAAARWPGKLFNAFTRLVAGNRPAIGIAAIIAGCVHFAFPTILFL